jgi:Flp pilus assembly pilin Flp
MNLLVSVLGFVIALAAAGAADVSMAPAETPRLMVLGLAANPDNRAKFEDALTAKLEAQGIAAIAGHGPLPTLTKDSRNAIAAICREQHVTAVVAVMPVSVDAGGNINSAAPVQMERSEQLDAFLRSGLGRTGVEQGRIALITSVYQVSTGRLVWGGVSWSFELDDVDQLIDETSSMIADNIVAAQRQLERLRARGIDPLAAPSSQ